MSLVYKNMREIAVKSGVLILEMGQSQREWDSYDSFPRERRLRFVGAGKDIMLPSLENLREQGPSFGFEPANEFSRDPMEWASMLSAFLSLPGPLKRNSQMMNEYYSRFGIQAENFPVRLESDGLRWYGVKPPSPSGPAMFYDIKCFAQTLEIVTEKKTLKRP